MVLMSALRDKELRGLEEALYSSVSAQGLQRSEDLVMLKQWQVGFFKNIIAHIDKTLDCAVAGYPLDYVSFSLRPVVEDFARLSGEVVSEEILNTVFADFCIGK